MYRAVTMAALWSQNLLTVGYASQLWRSSNALRSLAWRTDPCDDSFVICNGILFPNYTQTFIFCNNTDTSKRIITPGLQSCIRWRYSLKTHVLRYSDVCDVPLFYFRVFQKFFYCPGPERFPHRTFLFSSTDSGNHDSRGTLETRHKLLMLSKFRPIGSCFYA